MRRQTVPIMQFRSCPAAKQLSSQAFRLPNARFFGVDLRRPGQGKNHPRAFFETVRKTFGGELPCAPCPCELVGRYSGHNLDNADHMSRILSRLLSGIKRGIHRAMRSTGRLGNQQHVVARENADHSCSQSRFTPARTVRRARAGRYLGHAAIRCRGHPPACGHARSTPHR